MYSVVCIINLYDVISNNSRISVIFLKHLTIIPRSQCQHSPDMKQINMYERERQRQREIVR